MISRYWSNRHLSPSSLPAVRSSCRLKERICLKRIQNYVNIGIRWRLNSHRRMNLNVASYGIYSINSLASWPVS
uniref:Uncharacterized protein n=1 Tax=Parascaris equorum TaxID=6256 RepID=A0A914RFJ5_PAREQ